GVLLTKVVVRSGIAGSSSGRHLFLPGGCCVVQSLFLQNLGCFCDCKIVRNSPEISASVVLLNADGLEKEGFASHLYSETRQLPIAWCNGCLFHVKDTAFIQMSE